MHTPSRTNHFNLYWLMLDRIVRLGGTFLTYVLIARLGGKQLLGDFSFVLAFIAPFTILAGLGLESIVIRELVKFPTQAAQILFNTFGLRLLAALGTLILGPIIFLVLQSSQQNFLLLVLILSFIPLLQACDVYDYWFQSQLLSKYAVISRNVAFLTGFALKIYVLVINSPDSLNLIALITLGESFVTALGLIYFYFKIRPDQLPAALKPHWNWDLNKTLLKASWPLAITALMQIIYARIDQVMLGQILGTASVGTYTIAIQITEGTYILPMVLYAHFFPLSMEQYEKNIPLFNLNLKRVYAWISWVSIAIALTVTLLSDTLISFIYGSNFQEAADLLKINIWSLVFVSLGIASSNFLLAHNLTQISLFRTLAGALCNIGLNFIFIPRWGTVGAAYASLISYAVATLFLGAFKACRGHALEMIRAVIWPQFR